MRQEFIKQQQRSVQQQLYDREREAQKRAELMMRIDQLQSRASLQQASLVQSQLDNQPRGYQDNAPQTL